MLAITAQAAGLHHFKEILENLLLLSLNLRGRMDGGEPAEAVAGLHSAQISALLQGRQTYALGGDYSQSAIIGQLLFRSQEDGTSLALELQHSYGHYGDVSAQQPFFFGDDQLQAVTGSERVFTARWGFRAEVHAGL